jgi:parallel beta-helix repeat protein
MKMLVLTALAAGLLTLGAAPASASPPPTLVVDDDRAECAQAEYTSIQAAVKDAQPGTLVRVCPGLYEESVTVDKPLTLKGQPDAVEAVDCFDPVPSQPGDADPSRQAIIDGTRTPALVSSHLDADDVTLEGFVLQGESSSGVLSAAIDTSDAHSGYVIRHNLIRLNSVGIQFGSSGASPSRFEHNCLRQNSFGLATDDRQLVGARVDHNLTYGTTDNAFELTNGRQLTFDHNHSRQDNFSYLIQTSSNTRIVANTIESSRLGIVVGGGLPNVGLEITDNLIFGNPLLAVPGLGGAQQGIVFISPPPDGEPNSDALVSANTITGMRDGIVAAGPPMGRTALLDSTLSNNTTSENLRDGIVLRGGNSENTVRSNVAERNGRYGIYAQGAVRNHFETNQMSANTVRDAIDENRPANTWTANACLTDSPAGTICGVGTLTLP